jgi:hypothetical protein
LGSTQRPLRHAASATAGGAWLALALLLLVAGGGVARAADSMKTFAAAYDEGARLYKEGSYAAALVAYEKAFKIHPAVEALYGIGRCRHQLGDLVKAIDAYERFLAAAPKHSVAPKARAFLVEALAAAGVAHLAASDFVAAKSEYERAVAVQAVIDPTGKAALSGVVQAGLAEALAALGKRDAARAAVEKALAADLPPDWRTRAEATRARLATAGIPAAPPGGTAGSGATGAAASGSSVGSAVTLAPDESVFGATPGSGAGAGATSATAPGSGDGSKSGGGHAALLAVAGVGAAVVVAAVVVAIVIVASLPPPRADTDLGRFVGTF